MSAMIEFHDNLGSSGPVFGSFIAHPEVGRRDCEPEEGLREKKAQNVQCADVRNDFDFVALEFPCACFDTFLSPDFERDVVQARLIAQ